MKSGQLNALSLLIQLYFLAMSADSSMGNLDPSRRGLLIPTRGKRLESWWGERIATAELVAFLVRAGTARQLHVLYDDSVPEVSTVVRFLETNFSDVTMLRYSSNFDFLENTLRSYYHVEEMRNMIVIGSKDNTRRLFESVKSKNLESPTIHWYVIMQEDYSAEIQSELREGTQVTLAIRSSWDSYILMESTVNTSSDILLNVLGSWRWMPDLRASFPVLTGPLVPNLQEIYSNFGGRQLRAAVVDNWPFFKVTALGDYNAQPHSGIDCNVLNSIAYKLNFTYDMKIPPDEEWGGPQPDGSVSGMIGMVARREANMAINELTITGPRETVVDFTKPYFLESTTIISRSPAQKSQAGSIFSPFTILVWLLLVLMVLLIGPILSGVSWIMGQYLQVAPDCSVQPYSFNMLRNMLVQGNMINSKHWPHRFIFFFWYLFSFYIYALYSGTLTAVLAVPYFEKPIDSLNDLRTAMQDDDFQPLYISGTTDQFLFQQASFGIYKNIWDLFDEAKGYVDTVDDGVHKVLKGKFAYINAMLSSTIRATKLGRHRFYIARQSFYPQGYGIALVNGAPYKKNFDKVLTQLTEAGLVTKWTRDEVNKVKTGSSNSERQASSGPGAISLIHLQAAFFILVMGATISSLIFVSETYCCPPAKGSLNNAEVFKIWSE